MVDEYIGQTYGPAGMGMSAYSNIPDPIFVEPLTVSELGQTYGPVGMGMSAYMDRPGPMEMAAPPDNIGYDRMGPDLEPGLMPMFPDMLKERYIPNPTQQGFPSVSVYEAGLFDDPTADGGWIDRLSRWWYGDNDPENDYLDLPPSDGFEPYDPENPNHFMIPPGMEDMDIEDILEQMKGERFEANNGGEVHNPYMGPQAQSRPPTPEEKKPFGGTRENIMDHIEAFDNAPHHMEEPMVGMYGERVPLTLARRVQKYMEGLDPVKRDMIQETLNMFQMKKRMEEMEELNENSGFFGPIPNEYEA